MKTIQTRYVYKKEKCRNEYRKKCSNNEQKIKESNKFKRVEVDVLANFVKDEVESFSNAEVYIDDDDY